VSVTGLCDKNSNHADADPVASALKDAFKYVLGAAHHKQAVVLRTTENEFLAHYRALRSDGKVVRRVKDGATVGSNRVLFVGRDACGDDNIRHIEEYPPSDFREHKVLVVYLLLKGETEIPTLISELGYTVLDAQGQSVNAVASALKDAYKLVLNGPAHSVVLRTTEKKFHAHSKALGKCVRSNKAVVGSNRILFVGRDARGSGNKIRHIKKYAPSSFRENKVLVVYLLLEGETEIPTLISELGYTVLDARGQSVTVTPLKIFYANLGGTDFSGMPKGKHSGLDVVQLYWSQVIEAEAPDVIVLAEMSSQSAVKHVMEKGYKLYGGIKIKRGHRVKVFVRDSETSERVDSTFFWTAVRVRDINIIGVHLPHKKPAGPLPDGLIKVMEQQSPYIVIGDFNRTKTYLSEYNPVRTASTDNAFVKGLIESHTIEDNVVKEKSTTHSMITITVSAPRTETNPYGV